MVSLWKWIILTPLLKLPKNGEDWGKLIVAKGIKKLAKIQNIAQSGHTGLKSYFRYNRKTTYLGIPNTMQLFPGSENYKYLQSWLSKLEKEFLRFEVFQLEPEAKVRRWKSVSYS